MISTFLYPQKLARKDTNVKSDMSSFSRIVSRTREVFYVKLPLRGHDVV